MWKGQEQCRGCCSPSVNIRDKNMQIKVVTARKPQMVHITRKGLECKLKREEWKMSSEKQQQNWWQTGWEDWKGRPVKEANSANHWKGWVQRSGLYHSIDFSGSRSKKSKCRSIHKGGLWSNLVKWATLGELGQINCALIIYHPWRYGILTSSPSMKCATVHMKSASLRRFWWGD